MHLFTNFLILGKFNGHILLWGSIGTDIHGQLIEDFINKNFLHLLNNEDKHLLS